MKTLGVVTQHKCEKIFPDMTPVFSEKPQNFTEEQTSHKVLIKTVEQLRFQTQEGCFPFELGFIQGPFLTLLLLLL